MRHRGSEVERYRQRGVEVKFKVVKEQRWIVRKMAPNVQRGMIINRYRNSKESSLRVREVQ